MTSLILIIIAIGIAVAVISIFSFYFVVKNKNENKFEEPDYKVFFILGICFLPMGVPIFIATKNPGLLGFSVLGIAYLIIGLKNKDKWDKTEK